MDAVSPSISLTPTLRRGLFTIVFLRSLFFVIFIAALHHAIDLGTSPLALSIGAITGVILASRLALSKLKLLGFIALLAGAAVLYRGSFALLSLFLFTPGTRALIPYLTFQHVDLIAGILAISATTTWLFWRSRHTITIEALIVVASVIYLFSGHRNFHFDVPSIVTSLAWRAHVDHLTMLVSLGALLSLLIVIYLYSATRPAVRALVLLVSNRGKPLSVVERGKPRAFAFLAAFAALIALLFAAGGILYRHYSAIAFSRTANGVGQETEQGISPLGFHSALGSTNQPAALVRLEGDYSGNPFNQMLYFRESALSDFRDQAIVTAGPDYDKDVNRSSPREDFQAIVDTTLLSRVPLTQSIYLLAEHNTAFAVDYPIHISRLKNPNPTRFKAAYRVYSMAPSFNLAELQSLQVGDSRWSEETRAHYLVPHPDPRYKILAERITATASTPIEKAFAITAYLSQTTIYTLTPNHDVAKGEDPVAPYLFGDHRGYCVHFAHAMVYMFRALGIPSRIGTCYLTDLSQAKDGHILLRMSDRHAWAEIFIEGRGWIPFDIQPQQVESHAETQVDMGLLEELMGMLTPGEEILPKDAAKDEPSLAEPRNYLPSARSMAIAIIALLLLITIAKIYLRHAWRLPGSNETILRRSWTSTGSLLYDLGYRRNLGETRLEYRTRLADELGVDVASLAELVTADRYSAASSRLLLRQKVKEARRSDAGNLKKVRWWRRFVAFFNPSSLSAFTGGATW